jgi:hypothetical protein
MSRIRTHRYKVISGSLAGQVFDGMQIGDEEYPGQVESEGCAKGELHGVWLNEPKIKINRTDYRDVTITDEGVNYGNKYMDLCVPFDRFNEEIFVGDTIYVSSSNEVVPCIVEKIAKKPFMASYGIMNRKLTVRPVEGGAAKTINDPRSTVKAWHLIRILL